MIYIYICGGGPPPPRGPRPPHEDALEPRPQSGIPSEPLIISPVDVTVYSHCSYAYIGLVPRPPLTLRSRGVVSGQTPRVRPLTELRFVSAYSGRDRAKDRARNRARERLDIQGGALLLHLKYHVSRSRALSLCLSLSLVRSLARALSLSNTISLSLRLALSFFLSISVGWPTTGAEYYRFLSHHTPILLQTGRARARRSTPSGRSSWPRPRAICISIFLSIYMYRKIDK